MGLDDLVPDDAKQTSSRSGRSKKSRKQEEDVVTFGSGRYEKTFSKDHWEKIKKILSQEMGYVPTEVVNNFPAEERFEILHEAALLEKKQAEPEDLEHTTTRCDICGTAVRGSGVEIAGLVVCTSHPAIQIAKELHGEEDFKIL